jgi:hypothetical protein
VNKRAVGLIVLLVGLLAGGAWWFRGGSSERVLSGDGSGSAAGRPSVDERADLDDGGEPLGAMDAAHAGADAGAGSEPGAAAAVAQAGAGGAEEASAGAGVAAIAPPREGVIAPVAAEEPTPDERGRIAGTDRPTREETPAFQQFVAQMDTAHTRLLEGIEDCVEQTPSLRGQALAVTVRRFDSGEPPAVKVEGAALPDDAQRCFERKAASTDLPMPYQAQTIEEGAYTIVADTAAEFEWAFSVTP